MILCIPVLHYFPSCSQFDTGKWPCSINHSFFRSFSLSVCFCLCLSVCLSASLSLSLTHTHTHTHTHRETHARTHAQTNKQTNNNNNKRQQQSNNTASFITRYCCLRSLLSCYFGVTVNCNLLERTRPVWVCSWNYQNLHS